MLCRPPFDAPGFGVAPGVCHAAVGVAVVGVVEVEGLSWEHGLVAEVAALAVGVGHEFFAELLVVPSVAALACRAVSWHPWTV